MSSEASDPKGRAEATAGHQAPWPKVETTTADTSDHENKPTQRLPEAAFKDRPTSVQNKASWVGYYTNH